MLNFLYSSLSSGNFTPGLVPRPTLFFFFALRFALTIIHKSGMRPAGSRSLSDLVDTWQTLFHPPLVLKPHSKAACIIVGG